MSSDPKAVVRRYIDKCVNGRNLELIDELFSDEFVDQSAPPGMPTGKDGRRAWLGLMFQAFPDLNSEIDQMVAEDDLVATRITARGTHEGEFMGIPATGKPIHVSAVSFDRVQNGKITEKWELRDAAGLMAQIRPPAPPS